MMHATSFNSTHLRISRSTATTPSRWHAHTYGRLFSTAGSEEAPAREVMEYDVVTVGAGPAVSVLL